MSTIEWKIKGLYKADPVKVYEEINSIGEEYTPADIVELAEDPGSELHKCFEWDDSIAADKYRLIQAQKVCRNLIVRTETKKGEEIQVRVICNSGESDNIYRPTVLTLRNNDQYAKLLLQAKAELEQFKKRYHMIRELEAIFEEIDALIG
ncbi:MAG: hypothetical protein IKE92_12155 [Clostridiales bacterium]|nr:hypothetical protein [Clostridiales bacterium]